MAVPTTNRQNTILKQVWDSFTITMSFANKSNVQTMWNIVELWENSWQFWVRNQFSHNLCHCHFGKWNMLKLALHFRISYFVVSWMNQLNSMYECLRKWDALGISALSAQPFTRFTLPSGSNCRKAHRFQRSPFTISDVLGWTPTTMDVHPSY